MRAGDDVSGLYDPLIAKVIVHDRDRDAARRRMLRALREFVSSGVPTLIGFHRALLEHPCFAAGTTCAGIVESEALAEHAAELSSELSHWTTSTVTGGADGAATRARLVAVEVDGRHHEVRLHVTEPPWADLARRRRSRRAGLHGGDVHAVVSPMQGTVLTVEVADGENVEAGTVICVVEAMKMENEIVAHRAGTISGLSVAAGEPVASGQAICTIEAEQADDDRQPGRGPATIGPWSRMSFVRACTAGSCRTRNGRRVTPRVTAGRRSPPTRSRRPTGSS